MESELMLIGMGLYFWSTFAGTSGHLLTGNMMALKMLTYEWLSKEYST